MSQSKAVILGILQLIGPRRPTRRTKLVKLIYLLDESYYRLYGRTLTGFSYMYDSFGPNAEGNEIVKVVDELVEDGLVSCKKIDYSVGPGYNYRIVHEEVDSEDDLPLNDDDWVQLMLIVGQYGGMNRTQITRHAKATKPMKGVLQYDTLEFERQPEADLSDPLLREAWESATSPNTKFLSSSRLLKLAKKHT